MTERIHAFDVVRHFKGNNYLVLTTDAHWHEGGERLVVYRSYANGRICVRPYEMFVSEVDREKYPEAPQRFRFEVVSQQQDKR